MKNFRFYLDNGRSFVVTCEDAQFFHSGNNLTDFELKGVKCNSVEFLDKGSIVAIIALGPVDGADNGDTDMEDSE